MPHFSDETMERWRAERVRETSVPCGMNREQVRVMREVISEDMDEEGRRLQAARAQIRESIAVLALLRRRADLLRSYKP